MKEYVTALQGAAGVVHEYCYSVIAVAEVIVPPIEQDSMASGSCSGAH